MVSPSLIFSHSKLGILFTSRQKCIRHLQTVPQLVPVGDEIGTEEGYPCWSERDCRWYVKILRISVNVAPTVDQIRIQFVGE